MGPDAPAHYEFHGTANAQFGSHLTQINNSFSIPPTRLDKAAEKLAKSVQDCWTSEAHRRRLQPPAPLPLRWRVSGEGLTGRVAAATAERTEPRFSPFPGLAAAKEQRIRAGGGIRELYEVYGGLASGRILLVGPEAAGKSAAAVLLLLRALDIRNRAVAPQEKARLPVPVLLSLNGWEPSDEEPVDWAVRVISRRHKQLHVRALLETGRVALFLDGLDEVAREVRAKAISALAALPVRVLLISRTVEALETADADKARLSDAVALELQPVDPADAVNYLLGDMRDPPPAWRELERRLARERKSPLARALSRPLAISLLREQRSDLPVVAEILRLRNAASIENRLLDHAVKFAYTPADGGKRPTYSPEQAERTLGYIAARLTEKGTPDLCWWHLPSWGHQRFRLWVTSSLPLSIYLAIAVYMLWTSDSVLRFPAALAMVIGAAVDMRLNLRQLDHPQPLHSAGWRDVFPRGAIAVGGAFYVAAFVLLWSSQWLLGGFLAGPAPLWWSLLSAVPFGLGGALRKGAGATMIGRTILAPYLRSSWEIPPEEFPPSPTAASRVINPIDVWRHHLWVRLPLGLLVGAAIGVFWGAQSVALVGVWGGVVFGITVGIGPAVRCGVVPNLAVATALTAVHLARSVGTPVRLMAFLKDAHDKNLLRVTGPVYQFRHSRLRERLAGPPR
ncbi:hypothetical protein [Streptomyces sioyaensis]|uniref:hypothetical protein n=1 Tax=Streptomyces sioyaensis TaxID=67364 RepID=UPI0036ED3F19